MEISVPPPSNSLEIQPRNYSFQPPFATAIHPLITNPDTTFSLLREINASLSPSIRLPTELLLCIHEEIHGQTAVSRNIRDKWSPITGIYRLRDVVPLEKTSLHMTKLDPRTKKYYLPTDVERSIGSRGDLTPVDIVTSNVSPADFLYRLRCLFPEVSIRWFTVGYALHADWGAIIQHNTGLVLIFTESGVGTRLCCGCDPTGLFFNAKDPALQTKYMEEFTTDSIQLFNILFETFGEGSLGQFAYYHPAATADLQPPNQRYIAFPGGVRHNFFHNQYVHNYSQWWLWDIPGKEALVFRSILQDLKYDINSRQVDRLNGTANLTTIISSALLFYRLVHRYNASGDTGYYRNNITQTPDSEAPTSTHNPITSVWRVQLRHRKTRLNIIFTDDHGLFDIGTDRDPREVMEDIKQLVEGLCSDIFPYTPDHWPRSRQAQE